MRNLVELDHVDVAIRGRRVLSDLSFTVPSGTTTALVGETGSGKSMACRVMSGLLPRVQGEVTAGRAIFDGVDLVGQSERTWRSLRGRRVAVIPQSSMSSLNPVRRIGAQLRETIRVLKPGTDPAARSLELLEQVRMARPEIVLNSYPHELSGGMRQRVMIALALAGDPELLIADEPTTALDVTVQRGILRLIMDLQEQRSFTVVLVTHDLALAGAVASQVVVMYAGSAVEQGPAATVLSAPNHPYSQALLAARPGSAPRGERLKVVSQFLQEREIEAAALSARSEQ